MAPHGLSPGFQDAVRGSDDPLRHRFRKRIILQRVLEVLLGSVSNNAL